MTKDLNGKTLSKKLGANKKPFIGSIEQAPYYNTQNPHLRVGYRCDFHSLKHALKSIFMIHNETINIWSHLVGKICLYYWHFFQKQLLFLSIKNEIYLNIGKIKCISHIFEKYLLMFLFYFVFDRRNVRPNKVYT